MTTAVYPGTFDPVHYGHMDIATRAAKIFDHLIVAVYARPLKNLLFSADERLSLMTEAMTDLPNVTVESYDGLTVEYVRKKNANVMVRGLRVTFDFELEYQMALTNKKLAPDVETVCLFTRLEHAFLSSSIVKEVALVGGCVDEMVAPHVRTALKNKLAQLGKAGSDRVNIVSLRD
ncbi:MAG: pantetheine-phosphate adenylyltransferase [Chloroflexota bacterium]|nr:pantetheine-phosphate adenylyltransferase [Chloroflexota bacterium]